MELNPNRIENKTSELAKPIVEKNDAILTGVSFLKENENWYLRIFIDKEDGVNIKDCENISKAIGERLDDLDYIPHNYFLEVSSTGID